MLSPTGRNTPALAVNGATMAYPFLDYACQPVESQIASRYEGISARLRSVTGIFARCDAVSRAVTATDGNPTRPAAIVRATATVAAHPAAVSPVARDSTATGLAAAAADPAAGAGSATIGSADAEQAVRDSVTRGSPADPAMASRQGATAGGRARGVPRGSMGLVMDSVTG